MMPLQGVAHTAPRVVAAVGKVNDPRTWSGIPFHLLQAGRRAGLIDAGLDLPADGPVLDIRRVIWNLGRLASGGGKGGFQYSDGFLEAMWRRDRRQVTGSDVLNCFQLYPSTLTADPSVSKWFFIDQTLKQLFDYYEQRAVIGSRIASDAIQRETEGYRSATGVIVHSEWARASLVGDYGIEASRTHVVVPGPSLDADLVAGLEPKPDRSPLSDQDPLRLVFVGKEWERKGLDRLLRAVHLARSRGVPVQLTVIGCDRRSLPESLQTLDGVEWMGFIDKRSDEAEFVRILRRADIGCLLSRHEAGGIALREYHSVGLPVIGPDTGGAPQHMIPEASIAVEPSADDARVADLISGLCDDAELARLSRIAWTRRDEAGWDSAMATLGAFWPQSGE